MSDMQTSIKSLLSWETAIKIGFYLVVGTSLYTKTNSKLDEQGSSLIQISQDMKDDKKERKLEYDLMKAQIQAIDLRLSKQEQRQEDEDTRNH